MRYTSKMFFLHFPQLTITSATFPWCWCQFSMSGFSAEWQHLTWLVQKAVKKYFVTVNTHATRSWRLLCMCKSYHTLPLAQPDELHLHHTHSSSRIDRKKKRSNQKTNKKKKQAIFLDFLASWNSTILQRSTLPGVCTHPHTCTHTWSGDVAQLVEHKTGTPLMQVWFPSAARDFSPSHLSVQTLFLWRLYTSVCNCMCYHLWAY